jgi:hypothetical protein
MRAPRVRSTRTRLLLTVLGLVAAAVAAMTVGFNLLLAHNLSHSASDLAKARADAQLAALRPAENGLALGETPDEAPSESQVWVFSNGKTLEAPRSQKDVSAAARSLGASSSASRTTS